MLAIETLTKQIWDGATVNAGRILRSTRYGFGQIDIDLFAKVAGPIYTASIDTLLAEWKVASEAVVSDATLRQFVNAQALALGAQVAEAYSQERHEW